MANKPPFLPNEFFSAWQPRQRIWHSCLFIRGRRKCFQLISRPKKPVQPNFFLKKFQQPLSLFWFFAVPVSRKIYLLLQFSRDRDAVFCILFTIKLSIKIWNRFLNFCFQKFLELFKVKKNLTLEGCKKFWGKISKICYKFL